MTIGFIINRLIVTGNKRKDVSVTFNNTTHAVIGPSNTGKTYIFQCIKYLLGSTKIPKEIKESNGYNYCYLEITLSDNSINTIERSLSGGDAIVYQCSFDKIDEHKDKSERFVVGKKATKSKATLNSYLLTITALTDRSVRRNKKGVTDPFSFRSLRHLFLIDEISIIEEKSPVHTGENAEVTKEKSIIRFMLSGKDDSDFTSRPKQNIVDNRKGKMEVLDVLIRDYADDLLEYGDKPLNIAELEGQLEKLASSILSTKNELNNLYSKVSEYDSTIDKHWLAWKHKESRLLTINELLTRLKLLHTHYTTDLLRLKSLQEASLAYTSLELSICPTCNSEYDLDHHIGCSPSDIGDILSALSIEISKINSLINELNKTKGGLENERNKLIEEIKISKKIHNDYQAIKSKYITLYIQKANEELAEYRTLLSDRKQAIKITRKLISLKSQRNEYEIEIDPMDGDYNFSELSSTTTRDLCLNVQNLLRNWGYSDNTSVSFSEKNYDLVIDGYDRSLAGKGYRALSYAAFSIGLMHTCLKNNLPHSGVVVLDSPLCTLRSKHFDKSSGAQDEVISDEIKESFYNDLASYEGLGQVIVLDNDGPASSEVIGLGYTQFTEDETAGRYGFFSKDN
ncbi:coiled-coil domain-containing protein [Cobetia amphilecti]|uniref:coiled-coil domain-containing protein n=1 Tax=Cobetia amphilecti TaxID=1055104 RepID=UPI0032987A85